MKYCMPPVEGFTLHWVNDKPIYVGNDVTMADYESYCKKAVERNTHISVHHHLLYEVVQVEYRKYATRAYLAKHEYLPEEWRYEYSYVPFLTVHPIIYREENLS
jgi:hypothetical protein